jgi:Trypsin-like peptidase domain
MGRFVVGWMLINLFAFIGPAHSAMIGQPDIGKVVTFIFTADSQGDLYRAPRTNNPTPYGTGFFVFVKNETGGPGGYGYLVTDKHVLKDPQGKDLSRIYVRINTLAGDAEFVALDLSENGQSRVYTHPDPTVDLAVIPAIPREGVHDFKTVPDDMLAAKELPGIGEGSGVFFIGLFTTYYGEKKNAPMFRFGRIAMLPTDRIAWQDRPETPPQLAELYLLETQTYGGNSGSPVFYLPEIIQRSGAAPNEQLIGVIRGYFGEVSPIGFVNTPTSNVPVYTQNIGIAAVTPAYLLREILFSDALKKWRNEHPIPSSPETPAANTPTTGKPP